MNIIDDYDAGDIAKNVKRVLDEQQSQNRKLEDMQNEIISIKTDISDVKHTLSLMTRQINSIHATVTIPTDYFSRSFHNKLD